MATIQLQKEIGQKLSKNKTVQQEMINSSHVPKKQQYVKLRCSVCMNTQQTYKLNLNSGAVETRLS